jgi:hypothetical protein
MEDARRLFVPLVRNAIAILLLCVPSARAAAQNPAAAPLPDFMIPPPPKFSAGSEGKPPAHQATLSTTEPGKAYDWVTGQHLHWDCDKRTWMDDISREEIGYDGYAGADGEIIPPPPPDRMTGVQAKQNLANPTHAVDTQTGQDYTWDAQNKTWKDTKIGKDVGIQGWVLKYCPEKVKTIDQLAAEDRRYEESRKHSVPETSSSGIYDYGVSGGGLPWYGIAKYEHRSFYKWEDVSGSNPSVVTHDATSQTNGFGAWGGVKLGQLPMWGMVGGYYAGGLNTDATLLNGHRVHNSVKNYAFGGGIRVLGRIRPRSSLWAWFGGYYDYNDEDYDEYDRSNALILSEKRTHKSWTGDYGFGGTYWVRRQIGIELSLSYNGQFNGRNADENIGLGAGFVFTPSSGPTPPPAPPPE